MALSVGLVYSQNEIDGTTDLPPNPHGAIQMGITVEAIHQALQECGFKVTLLPASLDLLEKIRAAAPDVIFNACTGIARKTQQAHVVALLELAGVPFVGSNLPAHIFGLYKAVTKKLFICEGIPTPKFQLFEAADEPLDPGLRFPLIIKPEHEGSSIGITPESIVDNPEALRAGVQRILADFKQRALVEEFIAGREFTVGVLGNSNPQVLPIEEVVFRPEEGKHRGTQTYDIKERDATDTCCPAQLEPEKAALIANYAVKAYKALDCRGYARLDLRMDEAENPFFLEVNTLPGLQPNYSDFPRMAAKAGYSFAGLIRRLVELAMEAA